MRKDSIVRVVVAAGVFLLASLLSVAAPPQIDAADDIVSSGPFLLSDPNHNREWTAQRMRDAKPYPLAKLDDIPVPRNGNVPSDAAEIPCLVPGGAGGEESSQPETYCGEQISQLGYGYPPPFTRYENFNSIAGPYSGYKEYPYRTVGVLFFTQNGADYRCSASSIGNYAIWTAGHCVSDGAGHWSSNFLFIPAYRDGSPPLWWAQWTGSIAYSISAWHTSGDLARDMGGVVLNLNATGKKVSYVGWLGFAYNFPRDQHWHQIGYPSAPPFTGNRQVLCSSSHASDDILFSPATVGTGCDMTGGSSGGPWIVDFSGSPGSSNYLNGNVSYIYIGLGDQMYSPYFDVAAYNLWTALQAATP